IYPADVSAPSPVNAFNWLKKTENSVLLEWQAATDNQGVDHYAIYNHGQFLQNTKTLSAELTQLQSDTQYNFTVKAVDKAGNISASSQTGIIVIDDIIAPS
ncbi:fibronectin type III domain-containing protein, partial [Vibrio harveyi]